MSRNNLVEIHHPTQRVILTYKDTPEDVEKCLHELLDPKVANDEKDQHGYYSHLDNFQVLSRTEKGYPILTTWHRVFLVNRKGTLETPEITVTA